MFAAGQYSRSTTTKELLLHLYEANKIFRSTDFDMDGRSDNVGFAVGNVTIFEKENMAENKFYGELENMTENCIVCRLLYLYVNVNTFMMLFCCHLAKFGTRITQLSS